MNTDAVKLVDSINSAGWGNEDTLPHLLSYWNDGFNEGVLANEMGLWDQDTCGYEADLMKRTILSDLLELQRKVNAAVAYLQK